MANPSKSSAPIIKESRIPRQLQAVFLASAREGIAETPPVDPTVAFKVFVKPDKPARKVLSFEEDSIRSEPRSRSEPRRCRLAFSSSETVEYDKKKPVSKSLARAKDDESLRHQVAVMSLQKVLAERGSSRWQAEPVMLSKCQSEPDLSKLSNNNSPRSSVTSPKSPKKKSIGVHQHNASLPTRRSSLEIVPVS
jgi:hypothetical protein